MKNIRLLRNLITIYYYFMLVVFAIGILLIPYRLSIGEKTEIMFAGDLIDLSRLTSLNINLILLLIGGLYILYIVAIKLVKDTADVLAKGVFFTTEISGKFKNIGRYFLAIGVFGVITKVLIALIASRQVGINIDGTALVFILFGLFFMFLSEAFAKAQSLKEENELTV